MVSTTQGSLKAVPLKKALTVETVGGMYIARTKEGCGASHQPGPT